LAIGDAESNDLRAAVAEGDEVRKPGFTRLNLSILLSDEKVDYILKSVAELCQNAVAYSACYTVDASRAIFSPRQEASIRGVG